MTIRTKFDVGQPVLYQSKLGIDKVGIIEKLFVNYWGKKMHIGYFLKGILREFKEMELKQIKHEGSSSN